MSSPRGTDSGPEPLSSLVARSLQLLRRECPTHSRRLRQLCAGMTIEVVLPEECFRIDACDALSLITVTVGIQGHDRDRPRVDIRTSRGAVARLVEGDDHLHEQLSTGRLEIRAAASELARLDEALLWYIHGAIRSIGHRHLRRSLLETSGP